MNESLTLRTDLRNSILCNAIILGSVLIFCELILSVLPIQQSYRFFIAGMLAI